MTSRAQRFGPKIGGWRSRSAVATKSPFTNADILATVYLATWESRLTGTKTQVMVLALSDADARRCAELRAARDGFLDTEDWRLHLTPMPQASEDTYRACLEIETENEWQLRQTPKDER